ncbi:MAG: hypothetical protein A2511_06880 [Deltaproteobacteria bacterium RIFOXYD12_FULL_50_9]|nr:MAG: hypothetical protein A2511_06880 [Deltaproteobacteria bacterium RIFOXYD12_FULL_50_9]
MDETDIPAPVNPVPTASTRPSKGLSIVWLVPLIALIIAGWLLFKSWSEKGPLITITFKNAEGIDASNSKIKYKDVEIGEIEAITFSEDMREVVVKARMEKVAEPYLSDTTRFWIVRPRITGGQISGLGTLFKGSFISIDPGRDGNPRRDFTGLEEAPSVAADVPGKYFVLKAEGLGSLDVGSPVYYRQIKVGQVVGYGFDQSGTALDIKIFVNAPHDQQVNSNTRFWNASGIDLKLDATGIKIATESLATIITGGIAFELPPHAQPGTSVAANAIFELYTSKNAVSEEKFQLKDSWLLYFNQSVRGLTVGAPVEFRGIKIGEVSSIKLEFNPNRDNFRIPVIITIEPERLFGSIHSKNNHAILQDFVNRGLRGVLKNGNLLTGKLLIDFDFYPDEPSQKLLFENNYPVLPTKHTQLEEITESFANVLNKLEQIPFAQISQDIHTTLETINKTVGQIPAKELSQDLHTTLETINKAINQIPVKELSQDLRTTILAAHTAMQQFETLAKNLDSQTTPAISKALEQLTTTLADLEASLGSESPANFQLQETMREMAKAVRSLRGLTDYLERHPESLIYGKEKEQP